LSTQEFQPLSKAMLGRYALLSRKKYRDMEGLFLAEGLRTVRELVDRLPAPGMLEAIIVEEGAVSELDLPAKLRGRCFLAGSDAGKRLAQTTTPQGVFGVFRKQPDEGFEPGVRSLVVALDDIQDPGNVGTIIRTAAWFGAEAVVCGEGTADPYNAKAVRSSAGSIYAVRHYPVRSLAEELKRLKGEGFMVAAAALEGEDYRAFAGWPDRRVLVIGNEANGISRPVRDLADRLVRIAHAGGGKPNVESLNASVSAAILLAALSFG
jgi:RNA methyltransferase, TrmH family